MSGDTVRRAAVQGQTEWLKKLFASGANPCECDEVGPHRASNQSSVSLYIHDG